MVSTSSCLRTDRDATQIAAVVVPDAEQTALLLSNVFYSDCIEAFDFLRNEADELSGKSIIDENPDDPVHLSINTLEEYIRGRLSESETDVVEAHLIACGYCRLRDHKAQLCFDLFQSLKGFSAEFINRQAQAT